MMTIICSQLLSNFHSYQELSKELSVIRQELTDSVEQRDLLFARKSDQDLILIKIDGLANDLSKIKEKLIQWDNEESAMGCKLNPGYESASNMIKV